MSLPRQIIPGRTYLISRRCTQRCFFFRPDALTTAIFAYCLAVAVKRLGVELVAWTAMSNHYHAVVYDPKGVLPAFLEYFHQMLAKVLNTRWKRWESLLASEQTSVVYLPTAEDILRKVVYVLANPINDHLVDRVVHWPGCSSWSYLDGRRTVHERPSLYFRKNGKMPEAAELAISLPPIITERMTQAEWAKAIRERVEAAERAAEAERRQTGRRIVGRKAILAASPFSSPSTSEPRRNLSPQVAGADPKVRIRVIKELVAFRAAHEKARLRFIAGDRDVEFPLGTYRMRLLGARCCPFPAAA